MVEDTFEVAEPLASLVKLVYIQLDKMVVDKVVGTLKALQPLSLDIQ